MEQDLSFDSNDNDETTRQHSPQKHTCKINKLKILLAIKKCLEVDFDINKDEKNIARKIWQEVKDSVNYYTDFTTLTSTELLTDARRYLSMKRNTYTLEVVDVIVCATSNALNINIKYSKSIKAS